MRIGGAEYGNLNDNEVFGGKGGLGIGHGCPSNSAAMVYAPACAWA